MFQLLREKFFLRAFRFTYFSSTRVRRGILTNHFNTTWGFCCTRSLSIVRSRSNEPLWFYVTHEILRCTRKGSKATIRNTLFKGTLSLELYDFYTQYMLEATKLDDLTAVPHQLPPRKVVAIGIQTGVRAFGALLTVHLYFKRWYSASFYDTIAEIEAELAKLVTQDRSFLGLWTSLKSRAFVGSPR